MLGREAAERAKKSRKVSLGGFLFAFRAKNEKWRDLQLVFQVTFGIPWIEWRKELVPLRFDQNNRTGVRFSCVDRKSKLLYSVLKWLRRKSLHVSENWPKLVWILNCSPQRRYPVAKVHFWQTFQMHKLCRTFCAVRRPHPPSASSLYRAIIVSVLALNVCWNNKQEVILVTTQK